jgi:hypothetical protein
LWINKFSFTGGRLKAAMEQLPGENFDDSFDPGVDDQYLQDPVALMKDKRSSLEILREIRYGGKW